MRRDKLLARLVARFAEAGHPVPFEPKLTRLYPGRHQRAAGAFVWTLESVDRSPAGMYGSTAPATVIANSPSVSCDVYMGDVHLSPEAIAQLETVERAIWKCKRRMAELWDPDEEGPDDGK